jgi:hypothetical protein
MSEKNLTSEYLEEEGSDEAPGAIYVPAALLIVGVAVFAVAGILYGIWRLAHA